MDLNKLYEKQAKLDKHILEKHNIQMSKEELLDNTILALLVEVGELANTTRCFKHWSTKGMMDKEVVIEELSDVWHFYLSIGNQLSIKFSEKFREGDFNDTKLVKIFSNIYHWIHGIEERTHYMQEYTEEYIELGLWLGSLASKLGFADEEVEQAYLKKHEENYKRQREGY